MIKTFHQRVDYACMPIDRDSQPSKCVETSTTSFEFIAPTLEEVGNDVHIYLLFIKPI